ncbi:MAG: hypothetical protein K0Q87_3898 [Neobacillus sp.]|jgi:hypothetical protein|nr:hypothetical protein [Neobacillus sp.]
MATEHFDEQIRYSINQAEEQEEWEKQNIYEGVTINEEYYEFQEASFFEDKLKLYIPVNFVDMPAEIAEMKYPSSNRPQIIKTDNTGSINITLKLISNTIEDEHIPQVKDGIKNILQRLNPSYLFMDEGVEKIEEKTVGFFEFKSPTLDGAVFNRMFFIELNHNVIMGVFNCGFSDHMAWKPIARQIMQSLRICSEKAAG